MPKRRRLLTPMKHRAKQNLNKQYNEKDKEVTTARGRLKGALMEVLEPMGEESDTSSDQQSPMKRERRYSSQEQSRSINSDDDERSYRKRSPPRQSYVLKLFDRSVDLSQFSEDSPLYPICRAWIANQPKANYKDFGKKYDEEDRRDSIELPGPEGPTISRIPDLLPEQKHSNKDNINLNYREAPPPTKEQLLRSHAVRWNSIRQAWLDQAARVETRYDGTQQILNKINVNTI